MASFRLTGPSDPRLVMRPILEYEQSSGEISSGSDHEIDGELPE